MNNPREKTQKRKPIHDSFFDKWSIIHLITSMLFTLLVGPKIALLIVFLWEPFVIYILSPLLARFDISFGDESLMNSLSDLLFDSIGVAIGYILLTYTFIEQIILL